MSVIHRPGQDPKAGWPPSGEATFALPLVQAWWKRYNDEDRATLDVAVEGAKFRASSSGSCTRRLQYDYLKLAETEPVTVADAWRFELGHLIHGEMQQFLAEMYPGAIIEGKYRFDVMGEDYGATHIDALVPIGKTHKAVEIKSISGYPFKLMASSFRGAPEGPKFGHIRQLAIEHRAGIEAGLNMDGGSLIYLSTELLSPSMAEDFGLGGEIGRFAAQWDFSYEELEEQASTQVMEFGEVATITRRGELAPRYIPEEEGIVSDPMTGEFYQYEGENVVGGGNYWGCRYCAHRTRCASHPAEGSFES